MSICSNSALPFSLLLPLFREPACPIFWPTETHVVLQFALISSYLGIEYQQILKKIIIKYANLPNSYISQPIAFENVGTLNSSAVALISALGRKVFTKSNDFRESTFLFQRLAITLQRFNSVLLQESFVCDPDKWPFQLFLE